jgi:hypothetical protein
MDQMSTINSWMIQFVQAAETQQLKDAPSAKVNGIAQGNAN